MGYFSDIFKSDDAPVESDDLEQTAGFWSDERGQQRSKDLNDAIKYYLGPYLGSSDGLVAKGGQLANPIVGLQDSGVAFEEGRYVDAVTDLAGAAVPLAAGVVAKPAARAVSKGMDDAVDMVSETLTGFSAKPKPFDPSRRKAMQQIGAAAVAAPVLASDAARGVLDEVIAPVVKKTAGSTPLTAAVEKLMSNKSSMENILEQENSIFRNMQQSDPYMNTPLTPDQNTLLNSLANNRNTINRDIITSIDEIVGNVDPSSVKALSDTDLNSLLREVAPRSWTIDPDIADVDEVIDTLMTEMQRRGLRVDGSDIYLPPTNVVANMVPKDIGGEMPTVDAQTDELFGGVDFNEVARVGDNTVPEGNPEFSPTGRISTRMPIKPKKEGGGVDPAVYSGELAIGRDVMEEGGTLKKNVDYLATRREQSDDVVRKGKPDERPLFTSSTPSPYEGIPDVPYFPGFKALEGMSKEDRVKFVSAMQKENLEFVLDRLPKEFQDRAKLWYTGANRFSEELASKYGVPRQSMSGVLAALSPQKDWFQNASLGERVADAVINNRNFPWSSEMEAVVKQYPVFKTGGRGKNAPIWESIRGKKYSELETTSQKAMWVRAYDEAHNPKTYRALTPEGDLGPIVLLNNGTRDISWGTFNSIEKAIDALESGGDFNILSDAMGDMHKVRNFFNNIEVPFSDMGDVTIDTHAIAAALMRPLGGDDRLVAQGLGAIGGKDAKTGAKGNYGFIADDYREVASDRGLLPREAQSITWEGIRKLFDNKSDAVKQKVNRIWSRVDTEGGFTQQQALDLIESEMGGFGDVKKILTPRTSRSISQGSSTMFAAGGLLTAGAMEEGFASEPEYQ
tara:strand:- start:2505 stop:5048 length:2544 start_codon:yes stop_codon:yes gene_type:complete